MLFKNLKPGDTFNGPSGLCLKIEPILDCNALSFNSNEVIAVTDLTEVEKVESLPEWECEFWDKERKVCCSFIIRPKDKFTFTLNIITTSVVFELHDVDFQTLKLLSDNITRFVDQINYWQVEK